MSVRLIIESQIRDIAADHGKTLPPLRDDLPLLESGLDSLGFAVLVARLEDALGADPFAADGEVAFPVTLGDFIRLYESAIPAAA